MTERKMSEKKVRVGVELLDHAGASLGRMSFWLENGMADEAFPDNTRVSVHPAPGADPRMVMSLRYGRP